MLRTRILSALVMIPVALAAIWLGGYGFALLVAVAGGVMVWEWDRMTGGGFGQGGRLAAGLVAAAALLAVSRPVVALALVVLAAFAWLRRAEGKNGRIWALSGALYCGLPAIALVWLRGDTIGASGGLHVMLWLMGLVWATDIGAYAAGRTIGGPLLLPAISPKKTWAGLLGGMVCAALVGVLASRAFLFAPLGPMIVVSAVLAVVAQAGDLLESWVKRRCGVKDSSNIIPGHGGVLDRVDGLLAAALAVAAFRLLTAG